MPTITLNDGSTHTAKYTTVTACMPLISPVLREGESLNALGTLDTQEIVQRILYNLGSADFIRNLANGIRTVYPTISKELVWFDDPIRDPASGVAGLDIDELALIIVNSTQGISQLTPEKPSIALTELAAMRESTPKPQRKAVPRHVRR